jgi:tRNA-specific 2-thiouridylase
VRVLVAMSGGVDSSVAAAVLKEKGWQVVGATMRLWSGDSTSGCCSVADVEDARRVADRLGIEHHVFNFTADFEASVVSSYLDEHRRARTPNPCVECNRHLKFRRFLDRAVRLGFDAMATGHHARVVAAAGSFRLRRGLDAAKDQSYVLWMLGQEQLARLVLPVGELTKDQVRAKARSLGLPTADKPDSQDVCFVGTEGRRAFLAARIPLRPAEVVEASTGEVVGRVEALEALTLGQCKGLPRTPGRGRRYVVSVDPAGGRVLVGDRRAVLAEGVRLSSCSWVGAAPADGVRLLAQTSAHSAPVRATWEAGWVGFDSPQRRVAPGQSVALYEDDWLLGGGIACEGG